MFGTVLPCEATYSRRRLLKYAVLVLFTSLFIAVGHKLMLAHCNQDVNNKAFYFIVPCSSVSLMFFSFIYFFPL